MPYEPMRLQASGLECVGLECVRGERTLFRNLHCTIEAGAMLQICAENGAGKTSLLRILCGLSVPECGEVLWHGMPIVKHRAEYYRTLAYCGHSTALNGELSALQNLDAARALWARPIAMSSRTALQRLALYDGIEQPCRLLSAGQQQRVALARILLRRGGIWILDEPATALDESAIQLLEQMLVEQVAGGGMVIFTSHRHLRLRGMQPTQLHLAQFNA